MSTEEQSVQEDPISAVRARADSWTGDRVQSDLSRVFLGSRTGGPALVGAITGAGGIAAANGGQEAPYAMPVAWRRDRHKTRASRDRLGQLRPAQVPKFSRALPPCFPVTRKQMRSSSSSPIYVDIIVT